MNVPKVLDRLHAVAEDTTANPAAITYVPSNMSPANRSKIIGLLGLTDHIAAAEALDGNIDMDLIDAALAKATRLSTSDKIALKIELFGSGFKNKAF